MTDQQHSSPKTNVNTTLNTLAEDIENVMFLFQEDQGYRNDTTRRHVTRTLADTVMNAKRPEILIAELLMRVVQGRCELFDAMSAAFASGLQVGLIIGGKL